MIAPNETFSGAFPFKPNFFEGQGFKTHYVDEGKGEPIICLHGQLMIQQFIQMTDS